MNVDVVIVGFVVPFCRVDRRTLSFDPARDLPSLLCLTVLCPRDHEKRYPFLGPLAVFSSFFSVLLVCVSPCSVVRRSELSALSRRFFPSFSVACLLCLVSAYRCSAVHSRSSRCVRRSTPQLRRCCFTWNTSLLSSLGNARFFRSARGSLSNVVRTNQSRPFFSRMTLLPLKMLFANKFGIFQPGRVPRLTV